MESPSREARSVRLLVWRQRNHILHEFVEEGLLRDRASHLANIEVRGIHPQPEFVERHPRFGIHLRVGNGHREVATSANDVRQMVWRSPIAAPVPAAPTAN
jgi:hypothetical protein